MLNEIERRITDEQRDRIRDAATELRDLQQSIAELEERLAQQKKLYQHLQFETLPDLMEQAGIDRIGVQANGNMPAFDLILTPYYNANIAASWEDNRRAAAFAALADYGHEDLIKTEITLSLPRGSKGIAVQIVNLLRAKFNMDPRLKESVHAQTLTAWLKEQFEAHNPLPPLDVIGATVGRIVKLKERKNG